MIPLPVKVIGGIALVGSAIALVASAAKASPGTSPKPSTGGGAGGATDALPADLKAKVEAAVASGDPTQMNAVADELDHEGYHGQATALRTAANAIQQAENGVTPTPPVPVPTPQPSGGGGALPPLPGPLPGPAPSPYTPPPSPDAGGGGVLPSPVLPPAPAVQTAAVVHVLKGEGPYQTAIRILGNPGGERFHELQHANIPFDADGVARADNKAGGLKPGLNPGDRLLVPPSWVPLAKPGTVTIERVGVPAGALNGDGDVSDDLAIQRLAGRVAVEVAHQAKGAENRELIAAYQRAIFARGQRKGDCLGLYDAETVLSLATQQGIAPPMRFADGQEIYWPTNPHAAKELVYATLSKLAGADVQRREEWLQSLAGLEPKAA